jgi:predicted phosphate transport protein (TIGR00153 family)
MPKQSFFFDYFDEQAVCLKDMSNLFKKFEKEFDNFETFAREAKEIEHRADEATRSIITSLNKTAIPPFDREDIYSIARNTDSVIDIMEDIIHNIYIYQANEKKEIIVEFANIINESIDSLIKLISQLRDLKHTPEVEMLVRKIDENENLADAMLEKAMKELFEKETNPVLIIKWKEIIENLEEITDQCQDVSNVIEGIIIKSN